MKNTIEIRVKGSNGGVLAEKNRAAADAHASSIAAQVRALQVENRTYRALCAAMNRAGVARQPYPHALALLPALQFLPYSRDAENVSCYGSWHDGPALGDRRYRQPG